MAFVCLRWKLTKGDRLLVKLQEEGKEIKKGSGTVIEEWDEERNCEVKIEGVSANG